MIHYQKDHLTVFQSELFLTTSAVIETEVAVIVTDPNWLPSEVETIRNFVNERLGQRDLYIVYTHSDFDHIIGSGAFPTAKTIASEELVRQPKQHKEGKLRKILDFDQGFYLDRDYQPVYPSIDIKIAHDGQKLELGPVSLTFYKAPGHTNDGLFTLVEPLGIFLSGDYLSDVEFPFIYSSYKDYVETIDKVEGILSRHSVKIHVPGHGSVTTEIGEIRNRVDDSKYYLKALLEDGKDIEDWLYQKYRFWQGMKDSHAENRQQALKSNK